MEKLTNAAEKGAQVVLIYEYVLSSATTTTFASKTTSLIRYNYYSNGSGFAGIDVGDFIATLIQSADGEFVS